MDVFSGAGAGAGGFGVRTPRPPMMMNTPFRIIAKVPNRKDNGIESISSAESALKLKVTYGNVGTREGKHVIIIIIDLCYVKSLAVCCF